MSERSLYYSDSVCESFPSSEPRRHGLKPSQFFFLFLFTISFPIQSDWSFYCWSSRYVDFSHYHKSGPLYFFPQRYVYAIQESENRLQIKPLILFISFVPSVSARFTRNSGNEFVTKNRNSKPTKL